MENAVWTNSYLFCPLAPYVHQMPNNLTFCVNVCLCVQWHCWFSCKSSCLFYPVKPVLGFICTDQWPIFNSGPVIFDEGGSQTWINNLKPLWLSSSLLLCETFKSNRGSLLLTFATGAPMLASMCFSAGIRRLTSLVLHKVRWLLVQEREEGPNVNSSSSKRVVLQEPRKEPEGIRTVDQRSLVVAWSYITIVWNICRL